MDDEFKIYIDQLKEGRETEIHEVLQSKLLDIKESDLHFADDIRVDGVAYLAKDELILRWDVDAQTFIPCSICNEMVSIDVDIRHLYQSVPVAEIRSGVYNFKKLLRETILLELPGFVECNQGHCPKRNEYEKYLKKPSNEQLGDEGGFRPFADIDWK